MFYPTCFPYRFLAEYSPEFEHDQRMFLCHNHTGHKFNKYIAPPHLPPVIKVLEWMYTNSLGN